MRKPKHPDSFEGIIYNHFTDCFGFPPESAKTIDFVFPHTPVPQSRPRFTRYGARAYEDKKVTDHKNMIASLARPYLETVLRKPLEGALSCRMIFAFPLPASTTKKEIEKAKRETVFKITRPDIDNLEKAVLDALNGIIFKDDNQIVLLSSAKIYTAYCPYTFVSIEPR